MGETPRESPAMPDRLAPEDWIGYVIAWSRRQRPRHWDWEQAAIDGLYRAWVTYDAGTYQYKHQEWIDWQLRGAAADLKRYHARKCRAAPRRTPLDDSTPAATCEPWQIAAIHEEVLTRGTEFR
jgi:hypothetical protein